MCYYQSGGSCLLNGASCLMNVGQVVLGQVLCGASCLGRIVLHPLNAYTRYDQEVLGPIYLE